MTDIAGQHLAVHALAGPPRGLLRETARRLWANQAARIGLAILVCFILVAIVAPLLLPYNAARDSNLAERLHPPSGRHPFGTDDLGRDEFRRVIYGARISLRVGLVAVGIGATLGSALGLITGFWGRVKLLGFTVDAIVMRFIDVMLAFPGILLAIAVVAILGPSLDHTMLVIGFLSIPGYTRVMRSVVLTVAERDFILAARTLGAPDIRLLLRHILPNCLSPLIVQSTLGIAGAILTAAGLGFLGLGAVPPTPEWGAMISDSLKYLAQAPYLIFFPGFAVMLTVMAFNLLGDGLRDALDPQLRHR